MKCPVCNDTVLERAMRNHIIGSAKSEVWNKFVKDTPAPHADFYKTNTKVITKVIFSYEHSAKSDMR